MKQFKRGNYWIQKVKKDWNSRAYIDFYEKYGHKWLPKLIDHKRYEEIGEIQMEFIEGKPVTSEYYDWVIQTICYTIIPSFFSYSMHERSYSGIGYKDLVWSFMRQNDDCKLYLHRDLKFENFIIGEHNKLTLVGIDSFGWSTLKELSSLRAWKYKDQKLGDNIKVKGSPYLDYSDAVQ